MNAKLEIVSGTDTEFYLEDLVIYSRVFNKLLGLGEDEWACFVIPKGSGTNGASYNPLVSLLIWEHKRSPKVRWAAFGHDYLFKMAGLEIEFFRYNRRKNKIGESLGKKIVSNSLSNEFFVKKGIECGLNLYQAAMVKFGLFLGSWVSFNRYKSFNLSK